MVIFISPLALEYLIAFPTTLSRTCRSRMGFARNAGRGWSNLRVHFEALGFDLSLQHIECVAQDTFQLHKFTLRIKPGLNTAQIQQVIDQASDMLNTYPEYGSGNHVDFR